jgi:AcrR family transcriptional regulator
VGPSAGRRGELRDDTGALDRERIVAAALAIVDTEGVDALSMRRLARAMNAAPMSLYRHVRDKDELLDLLVEALAQRLPTLSPTESWQHTILTAMRSVRRLLVDHPGLAGLLTSRLFLSPTVVQAIDTTLAALRRAGLTEEDAARTLPALWMLTFGATFSEQSMVGRAHGEGLEAFRRRFTEQARQAATDHPGLAAAAERWVQLSDEELFEQGMALMLAGIAARAAA